MGNNTNEDTVWCLDALTGKEIRKHTYPSQLGPQYYEGGPGSTPTVDDNRVLTISKWGDVFCLNTGTGKVMWQRDLRKDGIKPNRWGFAGSPLVWRDYLFLNVGAAGIALLRETGDIAWSNGTNDAGYASPVLMNNDAREILLIFAAKHLIGLEPGTGKELWRQFWETGWDTNNTDPLVHENKILISSFSRGCALLSPTDKAVQVVYDNKNLRNHLSPGIVQGDYLYAFNGEAKQDTDFRCIHLPTGAVKWTVKNPAFGSLIGVGDKLLLLSDKGELILAAVSPEGFKPLARAKVLSGLCWTPPSLANGLLYARNAKGELVCVDLRAAH